MSNKEFIIYVNNCWRQGLDDGQIADKLGITVKELYDKYYCALETKPEEKPKKEKAKVEPEVPVEISTDPIVES